MFERFSDASRRAVVVAQETARELQHAYIGTEHLLLGLAADADGPVMTLLREHGRVTGDGLRRAVLDRVGVGTEPLGGHLAFTPRAKRALVLAGRESTEQGDLQVEPIHLLLGLMADPQGVGSQVLQQAGCELTMFPARVAELREQPLRTHAALAHLVRLEEKVDRLTQLLEELRARAHGSSGATGPSGTGLVAGAPPTCG